MSGLRSVRRFVQRFAILAVMGLMGDVGTAATLSGVVHRADGKSVEGWTLTLVGAGRVERVVLAEGGVFSIPDLPPGEYFASARPPGDNVSDARLAETIEIGADNLRHHFRVGTHDLCLVRGRVRDSAEGAVAGARVWLTLRTGSFDRTMAETSTDESGNFEIGSLDPENYELWTEKPGFGIQTQLLTLAAGDVLETKMILRRVGILYGRVEDRSGQVVEGSQLVVRRLDGGVLMQVPVEADGNGTFEVEGLTPGLYWISALAMGFAPATSSGPVELESNKSVRADFRLGRGGSLRISTRNAEDLPMAACAVQIERVVGDAAYPITALGTWSVDRPRLFVTDSSGVTEAGPLEPGRYRVRTLGEKPDAEEVLVQEGKRAEVLLQPQS